MNPNYGEDSAEVIASSVEEEDEAEDGGEAEAPEDGADGQSHLDRASSNKPRATHPTATGGAQAETTQPAAQRLTLPPPPTLRIRLLLPKLPLYLYFIYFSSL